MHWHHTFTQNGTVTSCAPTSTASKKWYPLLAVDARNDNYILGAPFLRSVYAVYDVEGQHLYLAPVNRNSGSSNVRSFESTGGSVIFDPPLNSEFGSSIMKPKIPNIPGSDAGKVRVDPISGVHVFDVSEYFDRDVILDYSPPEPGAETITATERDPEDLMPLATVTVDRDGLAPYATLSVVGTITDDTAATAVMINGEGHPLGTVAMEDGALRIEASGLSVPGSSGTKQTVASIGAYFVAVLGLLAML